MVTKCGERGKGFRFFNSESEEIHPSSMHQSTSNELKMWENLLEKHRSHEPNSAAEVAIGQRLEHYRTFKLAYLMRPRDKFEVEGTLTHHLAELVLEWMILATQKDCLLKSPDDTYRCPLCDFNRKEEDLSAFKVISHILCVTPKIIENKLTLYTVGTGLREYALSYVRNV